MAYANVGELKAAVADWINREDLTAQIPEFITLGENRILADSRGMVVPNEEEIRVTVTAANQQNPYPAGKYSVTSLVVDGDVITPVTWETFQTNLKENTGKVWTYWEGGIYYSGFASEDETPDPTAEDVTILYRAFSKDTLDINNDADFSPFFKANPELYLYAALLEASTYLRDMEGVTLYQTRYENLYDQISKGYRRRKIANGFTVSSVGGDFNFDRSY